MKLLSTLLVLLVAAEHFYIAWLEMTQIPSEKAAEMFKLPYEFMEQKRVQTLFSNQGLYNGFWASGWCGRGLPRRTMPFTARRFCFSASF